MLLWRAPAEAFIPMVRGMLMSVAVGLMLVWPAWRLGSAGRRSAGRQTAIDLAAMWLVLQVVIIPLRLLADYAAARLVLMGLTIGVWGALTAIIVWVGRWSESSLWRAAAMLICAAIVFGVWPLAVVLDQPSISRASPLRTLWILAGQGADERAILSNLLVLAAGVVVLWLGLLITRMRMRRSTLPQNDD